MKVLIIAPHQDDEILAMGGLIQKCVKMNDIVTVLYGQCEIKSVNTDLL